MAKSTKHIVGAGRNKKKGFPRRQKVTPKYPGRGSVPLPDKKPMPRKPKPEPLPYYPETGSNKRPDVYYPGGKGPHANPDEFVGRLKDAMNIMKRAKPGGGVDIKAWEDRNRSNNKTKLNP